LDTLITFILCTWRRKADLVLCLHSTFNCHLANHSCHCYPYLEL